METASVSAINWASGISLATLLVVVFTGGMLVQVLKGVKEQLKTLSESTIPRIHERVDSQEGWRREHTSMHVERDRERTRRDTKGIPVRSDDE